MAESIYHGPYAPTPSDGTVGSYFVHTQKRPTPCARLYGPKTNEGWPEEFVTLAGDDGNGKEHAETLYERWSQAHHDLYFASKKFEQEKGSLTRQEQLDRLGFIVSKDWNGEL